MMKRGCSGNGHVCMKTSPAESRASGSGRARFLHFDEESVSIEDMDSPCQFDEDASSSFHEILLFKKYCTAPRARLRRIMQLTVRRLWARRRAARSSLRGRALPPD